VAVSVREFRVEFPEFEETDQAIVQSRINMATRQVNSTVYGGKTNDAIKLLTAHLIAMSPLGEQAKLKKENRGTIYGDQYEEIRGQVAHGLRVI